MVFREVVTSIQNNETRPLPYTTHKIQIQMFEDLNVRPETIKLRDENRGVNSLTLVLTMFFWI